MKLSLLLVIGMLLLAGCLDSDEHPESANEPATTQGIPAQDADAEQSMKEPKRDQIAEYNVTWRSNDSTGPGAILFELYTTPDSLCGLSFEASGETPDHAITFWAGSDLAPSLDMQLRGYSLAAGAQGQSMAAAQNIPWEADGNLERPIRPDGRLAVLIASPGLHHPTEISASCDAPFNWTAWQATDEVFLFGGSQLNEGGGIDGFAGVASGAWERILHAERIAARVAHSGGGGGTADITISGPNVNDSVTLDSERGMWAWDGMPGIYRLELDQAMPDDDPLTIMILGLERAAEGAAASS